MSHNKKIYSAPYALAFQRGPKPGDKKWAVARQLAGAVLPCTACFGSQSTRYAGLSLSPFFSRLLVFVVATHHLITYAGNPRIGLPLHPSVPRLLFGANLLSINKGGTDRYQCKEGDRFINTDTPPDRETDLPLFRGIFEPSPRSSAVDKVKRNLLVER